MIEVRALTKRFGDVLAVDGLTFRVEPGTTTGSSVAVLLAWAAGVPFLGWLRLARSDALR